jgi:hypothetical protein
MTTSVFYPAANATQYQWGDGNTTAARSLTRDLSVAATVSERVFANGSGSTTMTSGTLTNTPTSGDVLIAVIARRADGQATITNPSGWAKLTGAGAAGSRLLEVWWYRSTGVTGDKGSFSWTVTSATGAWGIELLRFGGGAGFADPTVQVAATAFAATTTPTAQVSTPTSYGEAPGYSLNCIATTGASLGASGITAAFSGTGTAESTTSQYDSTYGGMAVTYSGLYRNQSYGTGTYGAAYTLGASRAGHQAVIHLAAGGNLVSANTNMAAGINYNYFGNNSPGALSQAYMTYDTSSIPDNNTVTSVTLGLLAKAIALGGGVATTDPANATLQCRYYGTSITDTRGNNNSVWWLSPSAMAAKTLVATYAAGSAWTTDVSYNLTSNGSFAGSINKTGNTVLIMTTDDYATANARASRETYAWSVLSTDAPLTVVHNYQAAVSVPPAGTYSVTVTPAVSRTVTFLRTGAASLSGIPAISRAPSFARSVAASITATPAVSRTLAFARTVAASITTSPTVARVLTFLRTVTSSMDTTPTISRTGSFPRTITSSTDLTPTVTRTAAFYRTVTNTITGLPVVSRAPTFLRTIAANLSVSPTVVTASTYARAIAATISTIPSLLTSVIPLITGAPRVLTLKVRNTLTLVQPDTIRMKIRSVLRLPEE